MTTIGVPQQYLGVWKRTLLRTPDFEDTTTEVYWLQTPTYHADIRVPANRPSELVGIELSRMSRDQLLGLTDQQGFAGVTTVEDDICRWHRKFDYQPPSGFSDVGRMSFASEHQALEYGIEQEYFEIWDRLPDSVGETAWLDVTAEGAAVSTWLLRAGAYVMRVTPRAAQLDPAKNLREACATVDDATLREWLNFEISFARLDAYGQCRIELSTLPYLQMREFAFPSTTA